MRSLRPVRLVTTAVAVGGAVTTFLMLPAEASTAVVHGVVSESGHGLGDMNLEIQRSSNHGVSWSNITGTTTSGSGSYTLPRFSVSSGLYRVRIKDPQGTYLETYRAVSPKSGHTSTRNVTMHPGGSIVGTVKRADGASPAPIRVRLIGPKLAAGTLYPTYDYDDERSPDATGAYHFRGLPAGQYAVQFIDPDRTYADQCYSDVLAKLSTSFAPACDTVTTPDSKTSTVAVSQTTTLDPQNLSHAANHIMGTLTDASGKAIKGIEVQAYAPTQSSASVFSAPSRSTSRFSVGVFPDGQWQLHLVDPAGRWATQWWDGTTRTGAKTLDVSAGHDATGVAVKMKERASLTQLSTSAGSGSTTFRIGFNGKATGLPATGSVTMSFGNIKQTADLSGGSTVITLSGVRAGTHKYTLSYSGSDSVAVSSRIVKAKAN